MMCAYEHIFSVVCQVCTGVYDCARVCCVHLYSLCTEINTAATISVSARE